jgi:hypothetical protein
MRKGLLIALVVAVILVIIITVAVASEKTFKQLPDVNLVYGAAVPKGNTADGSIKYLGTVASAAQCEDSCRDQEWCKAYTWHTAANGVYGQQCFGLTNKSGPQVAQKGTHYSGVIVENMTGGNPYTGTFYA